MCENLNQSFIWIGIIDFFSELRKKFNNTNINMLVLYTASAYIKGEALIKYQNINYLIPNTGIASICLEI